MLLKINTKNPEPDKINQSVQILKEGGIIIYPTDTIYGLGCDIFNSHAINRIYSFKKRDKKKPLSIICQDLKQVAEYAVLNDQAFYYLKKLLPGPYTFILKAKNKTPKSFISKNKTVGIRMPDNNLCLELVSKLGNPIITTSLNLTGQPALTSPNHLSKELLHRVDLIIDVGTLDQEASTIIDLSQEQPQLIRQGLGPTDLFNF